MASVKNQKIKQASKCGTKAEFWNWIAELAHRVWVYASVKRNAADIRQSELLNEVRSIKAMYEPVPDVNENS
jgi:hypothetical protein